MAHRHIGSIIKLRYAKPGALVALALYVLTSLFDQGPLSPTAARAHQVAPNGVWTYRYFTRAAEGTPYSDCNDNTGHVDPLNIINYYLGEAGRMYTHYASETHFGGTGIGSHQVSCITTDGSNYTTNPQYDQQAGHGTISRAHFRLFTAGHLHEDPWYKWSVMDVHHEGCCQHDPDEDWENWEGHIALEISWPAGHNIYWDEYYRQGGMMWRGFWDNGSVTRIGGEHCCG